MKITKGLLSLLPYTVIRDDREKKDHGWSFESQTNADGILIRDGTRVERLRTGDYTIAGLEHIIAIERKASIAEFVQSITNRDFTLELERLSKIPFAYVVLEFGMTHLMTWPDSSKLSPQKKMKLPLKAEGAVLARTMELQFTFPSVHFLFSDFYGKEVAENIFKRALEKYAKKQRITTKN